LEKKVRGRHEALHRRDIFDRVWNDVVVSDSALSQAIWEGARLDRAPRLDSSRTLRSDTACVALLALPHEALR
jgi:hypothetical protein